MKSFYTCFGFREDYFVLKFGVSSHSPRKRAEQLAAAANNPFGVRTHLTPILMLESTDDTFAQEVELSLKRFVRRRLPTIALDVPPATLSAVSGAYGMASGEWLVHPGDIRTTVRDFLSACLICLSGSVVYERFYAATICIRDGVVPLRGSFDSIIMGEWA